MKGLRLRVVDGETRQAGVEGMSVPEGSITLTPVWLAGGQAARIERKKNNGGLHPVRLTSNSEVRMAGTPASLSGVLVTGATSPAGAVP